MFDNFFETLRKKLDRLVDRVVVLPLFGDSVELRGLDEARSFVESFKPDGARGAFSKYEITILFLEYRQTERDNLRRKIVLSSFLTTLDKRP